MNHSAVNWGGGHDETERLAGRQTASVAEAQGQMGWGGTRSPRKRFWSTGAFPPSPEDLAMVWEQKCTVLHLISWVAKLLFLHLMLCLLH